MEEYEILHNFDVLDLFEFSSFATWKVPRQHYRLSYGGIYDERLDETSNLCRSVGAYLFSRAVASQVSSARQSLTSVFGMGTGGPSALITPTIFSRTLIENQTREFCTQQFVLVRTFVVQALGLLVSVS